jgi:ATPase subunit of ABC transporter with duplicated ATPase domains
MIGSVSGAETGPFSCEVISMSLIRVTVLTFHYEGSYDNIFEHASFSIDTAWKLGFTGRNGRGKTTFLKLLAGEHNYQGTIESSVSFEYFPYPARDPDDITIDVIRAICPDAPVNRMRIGAKNAPKRRRRRARAAGRRHPSR